jgi:hypothetical protein
MLKMDMIRSIRKNAAFSQKYAYWIATCAWLHCDLSAGGRGSL